MIPGAPDISPSQLAELAPLGVALSQGLVVFARMLGMIMVIPFFGSLNIPMVARVGLALMLSVIITPLVSDYIFIPGGGTIAFILLIANQAMIGLMLGLVVAFLFYGIESAGRLIDTSRGSNISDVIAPQSGERTSPTGQWLMMLALVILVCSGQHMTMVQAMIDSFRNFPATLSLDWIGKPPFDERDAAALLTRLADGMLVVAVKIAAPTMISVLLADVLLGIINRGAPQVNVFMFSLPIKGVLGIAAVFFALPVIVSFIELEAIPSVFSPSGSWNEMLASMAHGSR